MKDEQIINFFSSKYPEINNWLIDAKINNISFEDYIFNKSLIPIEEFLNFKASIYNLPIKVFQVDETIPKDILNKIPEAVARNYKILALELRNNVLYIGVVDPEVPDLHNKVLEPLKNNLKLEPQLVLISVKDFYLHLEDYSDFENEMKKYVLDFRSSSGRKLDTDKPLAFQQEVISSEEGPIIRLFELLVRKAVAIRASDIHLEPLPDKARIRFRLFGDLKTIAYFPKDVHNPLVNRVKILTNLRLDETRVTQDGRFRAVVHGREIDFRVGILPTINGEKVAIRILDPLVGLKKIKDLGLADYHIDMMLRNISKTFGMILVTGPTGSGKTTTLYALIQEINNDKINIISLEDPVEYKVFGINQSQIRPEIGYSFAKGLREILRQDPDAILVGEIRDEETAELATHAALTGHIVFSTLHTNTAPGAIPRLIDMGVKNYFLPSTLNLVIAQRLVRDLCQNCLVEKSCPKEIISEAEKALQDLPDNLRNFEIKCFDAKGCDKCHNRGYIGRIGIFEMFEMTKELSDIILEHKGEGEILEILKKQNFISLRADGIIKASKGLVSLEEVFKVT
ncbi:MAG: type IV-A pilus assembly ATPase PilB [Candidatus Parcubacteria bacterium]|nr:MAG: type IV-A pilus assembly ATPase PilB [Candidatus Parcubacteria bacterium]